MAADRSAAAGVLPAQMPLLLFRAAGAALGVEAAAVEGILDAEQARPSGIAFGDPGGAPAPASARVLLFKGRGERRGLRVDSVDEIVTLPTSELQPLPGLLSSLPGARAFWGCVVRADKVVLLVDVDRLHEQPTAVNEILK